MSSVSDIALSEINLFFFRKVKIPFAVIGYLSMGVSGLFGFARLCALVLGYSGVLDTYRAFYQVPLIFILLVIIVFIES